MNKQQLKYLLKHLLYIPYRLFIVYLIVNYRKVNKTSRTALLDAYSPINNQKFLEMISPASPRIKYNSDKKKYVVVPLYKFAYSKIKGKLIKFDEEDVN